ncbi:MAG: electron transport complex subunit E, partial [Spirochaetota bacterium]|nr:electron transport complex subunit E [Spirochaetota bacterium]
ISALRKIIPDKIRMPSYIIIIASFVTVVKLFMNASFIELYKSMGVFIALIVVNCIILGRAEAFANKNSVGKSFIDGLGIGLGFTVSITLLSVIREILGNGSITLIGGKIDLSPIIKGIGLESDGNMASMLIFILPAGGFITIGLLLGLFNKFKAKLPPLEEEGEV